MEDISLIPEEKLFIIGNKKYDVSRISAERSLKAAAMYNKKVKGVKTDEGYKNYDSEYDLILALLDCVFILIRTDFLLNPFEWFRRIIITKKHILKTIDNVHIMDFVEDALEPIIGDKKKELKRQEKMTEAMLIVMDTITPEALAELLQNSLSMQDLKKNIS